MSENLDALLKKIQSEAVGKAEEITNQKILEAEEKAKQIISKAEAEAEKLLNDAKHNSALLFETSNKALSHAARDIIIYIKKEIIKILDGILKTAVSKDLTSDKINPVLVSIIKTLGTEKLDSYTIQLSEADKKAVTDYIFSEFKNSPHIKIQPIPNIKAGFVIISENNNVKYEITDVVVAEWISAMVNPLVAEIIKTEVSSNG